MGNRQPEGNENLLSFIASTVEMIRDRLEATATKDDVARPEVRMGKLEVETAIIRGEVEQVHLRLDAIEKALSPRINLV